MEKLTHACNRVKSPWRVDFVGKMNEDRKEMSLIVDGTLVLRMLHLEIDEKKAKQIACERALALVDRKDHDIRYNTDSKVAKYSLFTSKDKRYGWDPPEKYLFEIIEGRLQELQNKLR